MMRYRSLGKTGLKLSEVGFGSARVYAGASGSGDTDAEVVRLLHSALEQGCNCFDTGPSYGLGQSETLLGAAFSGRREEVVLMTKFGLTTDRQQDHDFARLTRSVDDSLRRLQTDYVDILLLHNPPFEYLRPAHPIHQILEELRAAGKCRYVGASVDSVEEIQEAVRSRRFDMLEILFNLLRQHAHATFAEAAAAGVGLVVKSPLDSGWLSGRYGETIRFEDGRARWSERSVALRARRYSQIAALRPPDVPPVQFALAFVLAEPAVTSVIPASRNPRQLRENLAASEVQLSPSLRATLRDLWLREFSQEDLPW
jgi:aryl-alcohol dehydrogenase-like predicted oxidoreductase